MNVVALAGGVGGAKLADGLYRVLANDQLKIIVNCGDDFDYLGLRICPDLDTVCYTLAGLANAQTGWGRKDETWSAFDQIVSLGGPGWFHIGDQDLGTHLERTRRLTSGFRLSQVTADFCAVWGIRVPVMPMTDDSMPTWVDTHEMGWLPFQEYFVKYSCEPRVKGFDFRRAAEAHPAPGVISAIQEADCLIVCPSNPWVSIGPILSVPGVMEAIMHCPVRMVMSPIVGGKAIKGPAAKMYAELGIVPSARAVAEQYQGWCTDMIIDRQDQASTDEIERLHMGVRAMDTLMNSAEDRTHVAQMVIDHYSSRYKKELTK
jgi:LPPG:FO 2-phospho-L-lactate transferase